MVVMGRVTAPFGVKGWVKIHVLTAKPGGLRDYPNWWLGRDGHWCEVQVVAARIHGSALVAQLNGTDDRDAAVALKGLEIGVPRAQLPRAAENEFYWADLIGLRVVNTEQHEFGCVARVLQTGANDVLVVANEAGRETLIPFIADAVQRVDLAARVIIVAWGKDF